MDTYHEPYNPREPKICFDEKLYQLLSDVREPLEMKPGQPKRIDCEYERKGICNFFIFFEHQTQRREIQVKPQRTAVDFAHCMKDLVDVYYPEANKIKVVLDNLNTHTPASLYEAFEPEEARRIARKLEFHPTPKHASWLNMAEIEFSALERQCLKRRLGTLEEVEKEALAWAKDRTDRRVPINWCFSTQDARQKLKRFYER